MGFNDSIILNSSNEQKWRAIDFFFPWQPSQSSLITSFKRRFFLLRKLNWARDYFFFYFLWQKEKISIWNILRTFRPALTLESIMWHFTECIASFNVMRVLYEWCVLIKWLHALHADECSQLFIVKRAIVSWQSKVLSMFTHESTWSIWHAINCTLAHCPRNTMICVCWQ